MLSYDFPYWDSIEEKSLLKNADFSFPSVASGLLEEFRDNLHYFLSY